jgi:hypothetical protein
MDTSNGIMCPIRHGGLGKYKGNFKVCSIVAHNMETNGRIKTIRYDLYLKGVLMLLRDLIALFVIKLFCIPYKTVSQTNSDDVFIKMSAEPSTL